MVIPISVVLVAIVLVLAVAHSSSSALGRCGRRTHWRCAGAGGVHAGAGSGVRAGGIVGSSIVQHWLVTGFYVLGTHLLCVLQLAQVS